MKRLCTLTGVVLLLNGCLRFPPYGVHMRAPSVDAHVTQAVQETLEREGYSLLMRDLDGKEVTQAYSTFTDGRIQVAASWAFAYSPDSTKLLDFRLSVYCGNLKTASPEVKSEVDRIVELLRPIVLQGVETDSLKVTVHERGRH